MLVLDLTNSSINEDLEVMAHRWCTGAYRIRTIEGRNGEQISTLEVYNPETGIISSLLCQVDYDPSVRVAMIYG